jgi:hypothetical protein
MLDRMMPGGHLATSVALSGVMYATTGSAAAAVGSFFGGFLIDADHYFDYLVVERQWRKWTPPAFLRFYFDSRFARVVLPLHSWELLFLIIVVSAATGVPWLVGYLAGALMHLIFDVLINGDQSIREPVLFYSFFYRWSHRFMASSLLRPPEVSDASLQAQFWSVRHPVSNSIETSRPEPVVYTASLRPQFSGAGGLEVQPEPPIIPVTAWPALKLFRR